VKRIYYLVGYDAVQTGRSSPTFRRNILGLLFDPEHRDRTSFSKRRRNSTGLYGVTSQKIVFCVYNSNNKQRLDLISLNSVTDWSL
jgi:hypothetical protein